MSKAAAFSQDSGSVVTSLCTWMRCTHSKACSIQQVMGGGQQRWYCGTVQPTLPSTVSCSLHSGWLLKALFPFVASVPAFPHPLVGEHAKHIPCKWLLLQVFFSYVNMTHDNCIDYLTSIITCLNFPFLLYPPLSEGSYPNALKGGFSSITSV